VFFILVRALVLVLARYLVIVLDYDKVADKGHDEGWGWEKDEIRSFWYLWVTVFVLKKQLRYEENLCKKIRL
jgi:hypothetical protein